MKLWPPKTPRGRGTQINRIGSLAGRKIHLARGMERVLFVWWQSRVSHGTVEIGMEVARAITPISLGISSKRPPRGVSP
jgi:hypothetical protein